MLACTEDGVGDGSDGLTTEFTSQNLRLLRSAYVLLFSTYAIATMLSAFFTPIAKDVGITPTMTGVIFAAYPLGQSIMSACAPRLVGRIRTRRSVKLGLLGAAAMNVLLGLAPSMAGNPHLKAQTGSTGGLEATCTIFYFATGVFAAIAETAVIMLVGNRFKKNAGRSWPRSIPRVV